MFAAKKAKWRLKSELLQRRLRKALMKDLPRQARRQWREFEPEDVLNSIGLSTYQPQRAVATGVGAFLLGAAAGGIAALFLAPKPGTQFRHEVKDRAKGYIEKTGIGTSPKETTGARA